MRLINVDVENFRLLQSVSVRLTEDRQTTILVGPNNSGKTSLAAAMNAFLSGPKAFSINDFGLCTRALFHTAEAAISAVQPGEESLDDPLPALPVIAIQFTFAYSDTAPDLAIVGDLLMDLDETTRLVAVTVEFAPYNVAGLASDFRAQRAEGETLVEFLATRLTDYYGLEHYKVHPTSGERTRLKDGGALSRLLKIDFVPAQRHIDDDESTQATRLSKLLHGHYEKRYKVTEPKGYKDLQTTLKSQSQALTVEYGKAFSGLMDGLGKFGYPQKKAPTLSIRAELQAETLFKDATRVYYSAEVAAEIEGDPLSVYDLPERYNGLGFKNLIFIVAQLQAFREDTLSADKTPPRVHLIVIEEPEVHLHPQVQSVFVKEIERFLAPTGTADVQFLLTTHSAHITADSGFSPIRYFRRKGHIVEVKDLLQFERSAHDKNSDQAKDIQFLARYLTQTRCDLFFADKAILVEGAVERLLLANIVRYCAANGHPALKTDYITAIEVGGAHAHSFKWLIQFIEIPTLIVTDLDSVLQDRTKCRVKDGQSTSNSTLKKWLPGKAAIADLLASSPEDRTDGKARVAYQVPEDNTLPCGRSFEEAFVYRNAQWLLDNKAKLRSTEDLFSQVTAAELVAAAYDIAFPKVDFALDVMLLEGWIPPKYIADGLAWLALQDSQ